MITDDPNNNCNGIETMNTPSYPLFRKNTSLAVLSKL